MTFAKELKKFYNTNYLISFTKEEREVFNLNEKDLIGITIELISKCFLCNSCLGPAYAKVSLLDNPESKLECFKCRSTQLLKDSITWEEHKNQLNKNKKLKGG